MKVRLLIITVVVGLFCMANMSSPFEEGTRTGSAFASKDINILSESINIKIDKDFKTAKFTVEYIIQSDTSGGQIPLLFYAEDYKDSFLVWLDNKKVSIQNIPEKYNHFDNSPFSGFSYTKDTYNVNNRNDEVSIYWSKNSGFLYKLGDLKYFQANITKGIHKVIVEYTANVGTDNSGWLKKYSFRYSLTPAKFWKFFGTLNITVEQEGTVRQLSTNIGKPIEKTFQSKNTWSFNKLPDDYLEFSYTPKANNLAKALIAIEPFGLSVIAGIILIGLHLFFMNWYRRKFASKKYSPVAIFGSLIVPFLILLAYMYSYDLIDNVIGQEAGGHDGYVFLVIMLYPLILLIYATIIWLIDRQYKRE